ncbi:bifunctional molybdenum cofactor biosynthesis protein MoaC/MoaB [Chitinophaga horti]|uniref:Bifunctional molybdenum cofactor biosynthesis protein MoaC/MoaB n=1 Tax=Chitinophaga horti TaxID=2920382 RepID=A0ABY6IZI3_9BACT|nr:bifunctional molybdenum cofactor biosynthesis protein MoaC/MoaB [Chitinophaga horti]UYQ91404.1 bifunctional molybdenum cofactor biosynthesis protein MoaC/MoaB [Chitinophaga horti]
MINITHKNTSLRKAIAQAVLTVSRQETITAVSERKVPKGDVLEFSRAAGLLAIKKTSDVIPDCHPLPVEYAGIQHEIDGLNIIINVEVHTIYRTGVEVEAMHGAAITALTMYDMLKPIDKNVTIGQIKLVDKKGGKSNFREQQEDLQCAVIVCSDSVSAGKKHDLAGKAIVQVLEQHGLQAAAYDIIPDDIMQVQEKAKFLQAAGFKLALFCGGTGLSPRDTTPEAIAPLLDRTVPGIMEAARTYGQERTPYAMLSRGIAGFMGDMLVITLPGSTKGAEESMHALFPHVLHIFKVARGAQHYIES